MLADMKESETTGSNGDDRRKTIPLTLELPLPQKETLDLYKSKIKIIEKKTKMSLAGIVER